MTATLPREVQDVFDSFITTEYTTVDRKGQPITWPVTPYYSPGAECIDVTTGLGYPKKANDARVNPKVSLLFSDPNGSGLDSPDAVLVQGIATVDDLDLEANWQRYVRESGEKLPATKEMLPPEFVRKRFFTWYFARLYVQVRPERVYVWPGGDFSAEPELLDSHMEEVRSGHDEEPEAPPAEPRGGVPAWDERMEELGSEYAEGVLSLVSPDGFPFSVRVPVQTDSAKQRVEILATPAGLPLASGLACLTAHAHGPDFEWQRNFQVRGDLVSDGDSWWLAPHKLIGGFELPKSRVETLKLNLGSVRRFHKTAKRELSKRENP